MIDIWESHQVHACIYRHPVTLSHEIHELQKLQAGQSRLAMPGSATAPRNTPARKSYDGKKERKHKESPSTPTQQSLKKKKKSEVVESCYNLQNTQKTPAWSVCIIWIKVSNIQWIYKTNLKSKFQFFKFKELCRITACITVTRLSMYEVHSLYKNPGLMLKTSEITSGGVIGKGYPCRDYIFKLCKISLQKIYRKWRS